MPKILLQGTADHHKIGCEFNRGGEAVVVCAVHALRRLIPGSEFISFIQFTDSFTAQHGIKVMRNKLFSARPFSLWESLKSWSLWVRGASWAVFRRYLHTNIGWLLNNQTLKHYYQAAVIVDLSMDHFNDYLGIIAVIEHSRDILLGVLLGKPVAIYAQTIGPFKGKLARWVARFALNRTSLITVREEITKGYLEEMAVNKPPIYLTADPAFLLEPAGQERIMEILSELRADSSKPLIGIGTPEGVLLGGAHTWSGYRSALRSAYHFLEFCLPERLFLWVMRLMRQSRYYRTLQSQNSEKTMKSIAQIADHLVDKMGASVFLVPHFVLPRGQSHGEEDGRFIVGAIGELASNKDRVIPITGEHTAQEIKGIIGQCDLFISMKMHPTIAATSQCVPTVVIGTGYKLHGIMQLLGQEKWLCEWTSVEDVIAKIDDAWSHKEEIRKELESKQKVLREKALLNAQLVKQLLDSDFHLSDKSSE